MFTDFGLNAQLERNVDGLGFAAPTPIQEKAIPPALAGRDVLACATTGTGKTAAFLLPILQRLMTKPHRATRALVLAPTRELAAQVEENFRQLAAHTRLRSASIFGGVAMGPQERAFRNGVDVLVATPGRLLDHLQYPYARLDFIEVLVLDEADRMLDMGFLPAIRRILERVPAKRQTLLFSATMPAQIASFTKQLLNSPITIDLQRKAAPAAGIRQVVYPVPEEGKTRLLVELLERKEIKNALVFTRTKHRANRLAKNLGKSGVPGALIHGNRSQAQRTSALSGFRAGTFRVLIATDIAARGIDVEKLSHVVNFDVPRGAEDYIHRVGRTARAEETGDAWTFVSPAEERDLRAIETGLGRRLERANLPGSKPARLERANLPGSKQAEVIPQQRRQRNRVRRSPSAGAHRERSPQAVVR